MKFGITIEILQQLIADMEKEIESIEEKFETHRRHDLLYKDIERYKEKINNIEETIEFLMYADCYN